MRTIKVDVFRFDELSDRAKDRAREWYAQGGYPWADEVGGSLRACIGWIRSSSIEEMESIPYGPKADCPWTGYCADADLSDAVIDAIRDGETDKEAMVRVAEEAAEAHAERDWESMLEDDALAETCEANGYEFYEDGSPAH